MKADPVYDCAIAGGGLAGLSLGIQLQRKGYPVILFEKERYPFHKVCGEYISLESWNFLSFLGMPLSSLSLPMIKRVILSSPGGHFIEQALPLGGFGISRYKLEQMLYNIARGLGVTVMENDKVQHIAFKAPLFEITSGRQTCSARVCCAAYGKHSNLDVKWERPFLQQRDPRYHFVAVKYHVKLAAPRDTIALHNFAGGYCGLSPIEEEKFCLCYLTTAGNLQSCGNDVRRTEERILFRNPHLKKIFSEADFLFPKPVVISQVSFAAKSQVEQHVLMLGDAAGMIPPFCGNGMSMALHSSKMAASAIHPFLQESHGRLEMEAAYEAQWQQTFGSRLRAGQFLQRLLDRPSLTDLFIRLIRPFPFVVKQMIRSTHGKPF